MMRMKNDIMLIANDNECMLNESFDDYLDWNGYVVIDKEEWASYILSTITKDVHDPSVHTGELIDSSVDNFLSQLRSDMIGTIEDMI